jgi:hypothetical protein
VKEPWAWERPRTIKLCVQAPEANRLVTLWPDFKAVSACAEQTPENAEQNIGLRFLFGEEAAMPDWKQTRFDLRADGIPVHALCTDYGDCAYRLEAFCSWGTVPVTYLKLSVDNHGAATTKISFGVMARTGLDASLYGTNGDFYASYRPLLEHWDMLQNSWTLEVSCLRDGPEAFSSRPTKK